VSIDINYPRELEAFCVLKDVFNFTPGSTSEDISVGTYKRTRIIDHWDFNFYQVNLSLGQ